MKKIYLLFALCLFFSFPARASHNSWPCATTYQYLTSGSAATYTTGTCNGSAAKAIHVKCTGGGGGGGAVATNAGATGTTTSFNSINAVGGGGGAISGTAQACGIAGTGGTGSATLRIAGQAAANVPAAVNVEGGGGGSSVAGYAPLGNTATSTDGVAAGANTGAGGGGASGAAGASGCGGGGGETFILDIASPATSYTYTIGGGGAGGAAGTKKGGDGGSGICIVEENYGQ